MLTVKNDGYVRFIREKVRRKQSFCFSFFFVLKFSLKYDTCIEKCTSPRQRFLKEILKFSI